MPYVIIKADYSNPKHINDLASQLIAYSADPMGGGEALSEDQARSNMAAMGERSFAVSFLAYEDDIAIGLCNCFEAFSTFAGAPILNIHDIAVDADHRGKGVAKALMQAAEAHANTIGAAKLTLEVLEGNTPARIAYEKYGFKAYTLDAAHGAAQFWQKSLK